MTIAMRYIGCFQGILGFYFSTRSVEMTLAVAF